MAPDSLTSLSESEGRSLPRSAFKPRPGHFPLSVWGIFFNALNDEQGEPSDEAYDISLHMSLRQKMLLESKALPRNRL